MFDAIVSFFKKSPPVIASPEPAAIQLDAVEMPILATEPMDVLPTSVPYWLENEDALRDEGVIFGLTNVNPSEKTAVIHLFFTQQMAETSKKIEELSEKIQEFNLFLGQKEERISELKTKKIDLENKEITAEQQLPRTIVGLLLSIVVCGGNFFLIEESLRPSFIQSLPIAIGIFMAGMFNLFNRTSLLHEKTDFSWRQLIEEIGMPLAASVFVFAQVVDKQPIGKSLALLFFTFFLFVFAGKLFLSNLTQLKNDFTIWNKKRSLKQEKITNVELWGESILKLEQEMADLRIEKWKILPELNQLEAEISRNNAQRDMLIKLFESEYHLAKTYRHLLSGKQMNDILGEK
jgi:hypothetical protein